MTLAKTSDNLGRVVTGRLLCFGRGKAVREAAGLSLREAALFLGTDPHTLLRWEDGRVRPRMAQAAKWAGFVEQLEAELSKTNQQELVWSKAKRGPGS